VNDKPTKTHDWPAIRRRLAEACGLKLMECRNEPGRYVEMVSLEDLMQDMASKMAPSDLRSAPIREDRWLPDQDPAHAWMVLEAMLEKGYISHQRPGDEWGESLFQFGRWQSKDFANWKQALCLAAYRALEGESK
jgi:hypothetical protein